MVYIYINNKLSEGSNNNNDRYANILLLMFFTINVILLISTV